MGRSDGGVGDGYKLDETMEVLNRGLLPFWAAIWMDDGGSLSGPYTSIFLAFSLFQGYKKFT